MKKLFLLFGFLLLLLSFRCNGEPGIIDRKATAANVKYIILETGVNGNNNTSSARVAFYVTIPDSNNSVGTNFRTIAVIVRSDTSKLSFLTGSLLDSLAVGARIEVIRTVKFDPGLTDGQKRTHIDNFFNNNRSRFLAEWYAKHRNYGLERVL